MLKLIIAQNRSDIESCLNIRKIVFVDEQNVPVDLEMDDLDEIAVHFLVLLYELPVGTGRLVKINDTTGKIGRIAVLKEFRGKNIGKLIMEGIIDYSKKSNISTLLLGAQNYAVGFYEKLGFKVYGREFMDADIPHRMMRMDFRS